MKGVKAVVVTDEARPVGAERRGERLLVAVGDLPAATGWTLEEQGLCHGEVCVPVPDRGRLVEDGLVDLAVLGEVLHRPTVVDAAEGVAAMTEPAAERAAALASMVAPEVTLPDLDDRPVSLSDFTGKKKLLVAWASW